MIKRQNIEEQILSLWDDDKDTAFELLVQEFAKPLYTFIRHIVHTHEDADDILQETFIKLWKGLDTFRKESALSTFIYRIAYNETISFLRKQRRRFKILHPFSNFEDWYLQRIKADPYIDYDAVYKKILQEIALLPPRQKAVFSLRHFDGLPFKEIATRLGISESTARTTYHQVVNKLKTKISELNIHDPTASKTTESTKTTK